MFSLVTLHASSLTNGKGAYNKIKQQLQVVLDITIKMKTSYFFYLKISVDILYPPPGDFCKM